eukprot:scaffold721_cov131-Cylindrotheca_fusiformis.AAC.78
MSRNQFPFARIVGATASVALSLVVYQTVTEYGWEGAINYVWVGDPYYGSPVGKYLQILCAAKASLAEEEARMNEIEEALERARLDSTEGGKSATKETATWWMANYPGLEKSLAGLSSKLDKIAAKVDGILISKVGSNPKKVEELKRNKKMLSKQLVVSMERCDALIATFKVLQDSD